MAFVRRFRWCLLRVCIPNMMMLLPYNVIVLGCPCLLQKHPSNPPTREKISPGNPMKSIWNETLHILKLIFWTFSLCYWTPFVRTWLCSNCIFFEGHQRFCLCECCPVQSYYDSVIPVVVKLLSMINVCYLENCNTFNVFFLKWFHNCSTSHRGLSFINFKPPPVLQLENSGEGLM